MPKLLSRFKSNHSGASAAEYALMIALIGGVIVVAASLLGTNISSVFTNFAAIVKYT